MVCTSSGTMQMLPKSFTIFCHLLLPPACDTTKMQLAHLIGSHQWEMPSCTGFSGSAWGLITSHLRRAAISICLGPVVSATCAHYKFRGGFCIYHGSGTFCDSIPALRAAGMGFGMPNPIPKYGNTLEVYQESQTYQRLVVLCLVYQKPVQRPVSNQRRTCKW